MIEDRSDELLILKPEGIIIFSYKFNSRESIESVEENKKILIAGFLAAILEFARQITSSDVSYMEIGKRSIYMIKGKKHGLIYVYLTSIGKKSKKVMGKLTDIMKKFEELYSTDDLSAWDGSDRYFMDFAGYLEETTDKNIEEFFGI